MEAEAEAEAVEAARKSTASTFQITNNHSLWLYSSIIGNSSTRQSEETSLGALNPFLKQRLAFLKQHLLGPTSHPPKSITSSPLLGSFLLDYIRACLLGSIRMIIGYSSANTTINVKLLSIGSSKTIFLAASSSSASCIPSYIRNWASICVIRHTSCI